VRTLVRTEDGGHVLIPKIVNFKTMRDTAKIRSPSRQLSALSIFEIYCQRPNWPLKWTFGLFLKN
jgi:hypothetical protein